MVFKYLVVLMLACMPMVSMSAEFVEGKDFQLIQSSASTKYKGGPVRVTEFFSYGCPWCYRVDAAISSWVDKQGKAIKFTQVPVVFNPNWGNYARAYYLIRGLSLDKSVHDTLFKLIIVDKKTMNKPQELVEFFVKQGVNPAIAQSTFSQSPSVEMKLKQGDELMARYQINAIPTLVVNHQYKTNLQMATSEARLFEILNYLVQRVQHEKS